MRSGTIQTQPERSEVRSFFGPSSLNRGHQLPEAISSHLKLSGPISSLLLFATAGHFVPPMFRTGCEMGNPIEGTLTVGYGRLRSVTDAFLQRRPAHRAGSRFHSLLRLRVWNSTGQLLENYFCTISAPVFALSRNPPLDYQALARKIAPSSVSLQCLCRAASPHRNNAKAGPGSSSIIHNP